MPRAADRAGPFWSWSVVSGPGAQHPRRRPVDVQVIWTVGAGPYRCARQTSEVTPSWTRWVPQLLERYEAVRGPEVGANVIAGRNGLQPTAF